MSQVATKVAKMSERVFKKPGGGGAVTVHYDAAGNLSRDEDDYEYLYDYDSRLTKVTYEGGVGSTQVAAFEYDALGRMISSQLRFDADQNGMNQTLKYYYDGPNVIAEYDASDNLSRRYIHGKGGIDERAVLLEGEGDLLDTFYYLSQELDTVTGLISKNGTLAEANVYDAYGKVTTWGYRPMDFNRDGDVDVDDIDEFFSTFLTKPSTDPMADSSNDGWTEMDDWDIMIANVTSSGEPPITLYTSSVGNPYHFTGRRLHFIEDLTESGTTSNKQVQYNRARHYGPSHGRWLQRDPSGYTDGMNLYEYVTSRPTRFSDPTGKRKYCCQERGAHTRRRGPGNISGEKITPFGRRRVTANIDFKIRRQFKVTIGIAGPTVGGGFDDADLISVNFNA